MPNINISMLKKSDNNNKLKYYEDLDTCLTFEVLI